MGICLAGLAIPSQYIIRIYNPNISFLVVICHQYQIYLGLQIQPDGTNQKLNLNIMNNLNWSDQSEAAINAYTSSLNDVFKDTVILQYLTISSDYSLASFIEYKAQCAFVKANLSFFMSVQIHRNQEMSNSHKVDFYYNDDDEKQLLISNSNEFQLLKFKIEQNGQEVLTNTLKINWPKFFNVRIEDIPRFTTTLISIYPKTPLLTPIIFNF